MAASEPGVAAVEASTTPRAAPSRTFPGTRGSGGGRGCGGRSSSAGRAPLTSARQDRAEEVVVLAQRRRLSLASARRGSPNVVCGPGWRRTSSRRKPILSGGGARGRTVVLRTPRLGEPVESGRRGDVKGPFTPQRQIRGRGLVKQGSRRGPRTPPQADPSLQIPPS